MIRIQFFCAGTSCLWRYWMMLQTRIYARYVFSVCARKRLINNSVPTLLKLSHLVIHLVLKRRESGPELKQLPSTNLASLAQPLKKKLQELHSKTAQAQ
jgi:hypothetical protein